MININFQNNEPLDESRRKLELDNLYRNMNLLKRKLLELENSYENIKKYHSTAYNELINLSSRYPVDQRGFIDIGKNKLSDALRDLDYWYFVKRQKLQDESRSLNVYKYNLFKTRL